MARFDSSRFDDPGPLGRWAATPSPVINRLLDPATWWRFHTLRRSLIRRGALRPQPLPPSDQLVGLAAPLPQEPPS